ncbi:MAG: sulfotransferase [Pirellulales bacterium]
MKEPSPPTKPANSEPFVDRWFHPRIWDGLDVGSWLSLLSRNRFAVHWSRASVALVVSIMAPCHTVLRWVQTIFWGKQINRTEIKEQPLFILGHWRSGTTFLHELLVLDERHSFPTSYECFAPHHFLLTEGIISRWFNWVMPKKRPMDNMAVGWDRPQEDEFALCNIGLPSPYLTLAFPNRPPQYQEYLTFDDVPPEDVARWQSGFRRFLTMVTCRNPKRMVLKSPPHTGRIRVLAEMFPDARFVHIVRDPYVLFQSTMKMWKAMYDVQGLQPPKFEGLEEHVFETLNFMYAAFERDRHLIGPGRFCEVRYEDLVRDPVGQLRAIYDQLELDGFEEALPAFQEHLAGQSDYQPNRHQMPAELKAKIADRWADFIQRYGY